MIHWRIHNPLNHKICLLFDAFRLDTFTLASYRSLQIGLEELCDVFLVFHKSNDDPDFYPSNTVVLDDQRIFDKIQTNKTKNRKIIPGNSDLKVIAAVEELPSYESYIFMEYDVVCLGDLRHVFGRLITYLEGVDFAGSYIETPAQNPRWMWWSSIKPPIGTRLDKQHLLKSFLPLAAYSRRFILSYRDALLEGWEGHNEVLFPTIAKRNAMHIMSLEHSDKNFTSWPAFDATKPEGLDQPELPSFIHPVKTVAEYQRLPARIREMSHVAATLPPECLGS